jgi:hypothetical protein
MYRSMVTSYMVTSSIEVMYRSMVTSSIVTSCRGVATAGRHGNVFYAVMCGMWKLVGGSTYKIRLAPTAVLSQDRPGPP